MTGHDCSLVSNNEQETTRNGNICQYQTQTVLI